MVRELLVHARLAQIPPITELLRKHRPGDGGRQACLNPVGTRGLPRPRASWSPAAPAMALAGISGKSIVLTAVLPPGRFADSDAAFNIGRAYGAIQLCSPAVYAVANGTVFRRTKSEKPGN